MAFVTSTVLAIAAAATAVVGTAASIQAQKKAGANARDAAAKADLAAGEQKAQQAEAAANERRQQIREERVKRARILQSAENTGTSDSSGEVGALGGLSTNLNTNVGLNAGAVARGARLSTINQGIANDNFAMQRNMGRSKNMSTLASVGGSIFSAAGGFSAFKTGTVPQETGLERSIFSGTSGIAD